MPAADPDPLGGQWHGFSGPWRGGYLTSLEGSNRVPCIVRWPGKVPAGRVSNELVHLFQQDAFASTWLPYSIPHIHNLEWDPREEHEIDFPHAWVLHPMAAAAGAFLQTLAIEPPIKPGGTRPVHPARPG